MDKTDGTFSPVCVVTTPGEVMRDAEEVAAMVRLHQLGWGSRRIAAELGCSRTTVRHHVGVGEWRGYRRRASRSLLSGHESWLSACFSRHRGNADVVRQELARELGITVSLRTVERAVAPLRQALAAEARATVRFETAPGQQLQIDFGERLVPIGGVNTRVYLFVATLGYSRRLFVRPFGHERQSAWFAGLECAFHHFGGIPREVLVDNARALVEFHDARTREVRFNARFLAFARDWGFTPHACAPYRARTKGKDERGVGYVKRNAIAGHDFASWAALEAHLVSWTRDVADTRRHGTTEEAPRERFERAEATALRALAGRTSFNTVREVVRRVGSEGTIELDTNRYSVPWRLIGMTLRVTVRDGEVRIERDGMTVAVHAEVSGRRRRVSQAAHYHGMTHGEPRSVRPLSEASILASSETLTQPALSRPLAEYEALLGGGWS